MNILESTTFEEYPQGKIFSKSIKEYIEIIKKTNDLSRDVELKYVKKAKKNLKYKELLFNAHYKMVMGMAKKYTTHVETLEDLLNEGVKGLEQALKLFKPKMKVRFNTYARYWVRAFILKYFSDNVRGFKVPSDIAIKLTTMNKVIEKLSKKLLREPTDKEIARELQYDKNYVRFLRKYLYPHFTLQYRVGTCNHNTSGQFTLGDVTSDDHRDNARESLVRVDGINKIRAAIESLPKKERFVIENRYGLNGCDEQTLAQVGKRMRLTAERVRQIQEIAETRLKKMINR